MKRTSMRYIVLLVILISIHITPATKTWVGYTNDWNTSSNWSPTGIPNSTDDIVIPSVPLGGNSLIISSGNYNINRLTINSSGSLTISGGTLVLKNACLINDTLNISSGKLDLGTNTQKITVDGGTVNQSGGIVSTKDMELKNGATYNQSNGEFQISHDLKVPPGNTFNGTGGTVHFVGVAGAGADYSGNVQFHNVIIDNTADYNSNKSTDNIKISGNFVNYNPNLDNSNGTVTFNGTSPQTIYSASTPPATNTTFGNLVLNNPSGVQLLSNLGVASTFTNNFNGSLNYNTQILYVNGVIYEDPLPVELSSFSATIIGTSVKLKWMTSTEVNNYGFEIERKSISNSQTSELWSKIGFVEGSGNVNSPKTYSFTDNNLNSGKYAYRLKQIDNDGKYEYSGMVEIEINRPGKMELSQNFPNPFNPSTLIKFNLPEAGMVKLSVYNILGQEIRTLVDEYKESGAYQYKFDAGDLNSGIYIYKIESGSFVQTRKMTLVK